MTWAESWQPRDLVALEETANVRSFAMDPAWAEAASSSGYATPLRLGLEDRGSLQAAAMGLRRVRMGLSKVVCGSNGGVGMLALNPSAGARLLEEIRRRWRPSVLQVFAQETLPTHSFAWEPSFTIHLDLRSPLDEVQARFDKSVRNSLTRAARRGVMAESAVSSADQKRAYTQIRQTALSKGFVLPERGYLNAVHSVFKKAGMSEIVVAKKGDSQ